MARSITDARQVTLRAFLQQIANAASYAGTADSKPANQSELDNLLSSLNEEVTPLLRMSASSTPDLVVTVGAGKLTNSESSYTRAIPHVGTAYVQFASGTLTFPASSGGNIVASPGNPSVLTLGVGNYAAVLIYLDGNGNLNTIVGAEDAVEATAITNLPPSPDSTLPIGYVVVHNTGGTIDAIAQNKIAQFGTGAGGGGSGDASLAEVALRDRFAQSGFKYLDPNIFKRDKDTKVDGASTGVFDLVKSAFKLTSIGQTYVSTNLANSEFLAEGVDITEIELSVYWLLSFVDSAATYEASRDGGTNWTTLDIERVGTDSNAFRAYQVFEDESVQQSLQTVAATGAGTALNATTAQELSSQLVMSSTGVVRSIDLLMNKAAAAVGNLYVSIVRNNAGVPSTDLEDLVCESDAVNISTLSTGDITVTVDLPDTVLTADTYHVVLRTDSAYKAGTMDLSWRNGSGTNGAAYNGTVWTGSASTKAATVKGRLHDLRIRITGSATNRYIEAIGVNFGADDGILAPNGTKNVQRFYFSGDENRTQFTLNWTPDPDIFEMYDAYRGQVYVIDNDTVRLSGQTVTFDPDTFDFPGEEILLIARQIKGIGIDNSDSNAANISEHATNLLDIGSQISELDFVSIPKIAVPYTTIVNRAYIPDPSQDLAGRMGITRIPIHSLYQLQNEFGANGESVYGVLNDRFDQIRVVGNADVPPGQVGGNYIRVGTQSDTSSYLEITFYGTGLNVLALQSGATEDIRVSVDGGGEGANLFPLMSTVIAGRNYSGNVVLPIVSGLSLGVHTVKIRSATAATAFHCHGVEVLNESSTISVTPGSQYVKGKKVTLATLQSLAYNSDFETGVLGTRGGRVLAYQKSDGTIGKAVQPAGASQLNLTSANHADEEVCRSHYFREFGSGRADDFSSLSTTGSTRMFTLEDDTTALFLTNGTVVSHSTGVEGVRIGPNTNFIQLSFVGTGLDIERFDTANGGSDTYTINVNGTDIGTLATTGSTARRLTKIVSGLPYGTHVVRITKTSAATWDLAIVRYVVYQPKTPSVPVGAKKIANYNIMANFVANSTAGNTRIATGVLRKHVLRELVYTGTWSAIQDINAMNWQFTETSGVGATWQYTFWGTGFDYRQSAFSNRATGGFKVNIDGVDYTGAASVYGTGVTWTPGTSIVEFNDAGTTNGAGFVVSGLTLGLHTVRFTNQGGGSALMSPEALDIITPIHSPKSNLYSNIQNTLPIGSCALEDLRKIAPLEQVSTNKFRGTAVGVTASPSTTSTVLVPVPDLSMSVPSNGAWFEIRMDMHIRNSAGTNAGTAIFVNGVNVAERNNSGPATNIDHFYSWPALIYLAPGVHKVDIYWKAQSGTLTNFSSRVMTVKEL